MLYRLFQRFSPTMPCQVVARLTIAFCVVTVAAAVATGQAADPLSPYQSALAGLDTLAGAGRLQPMVVDAQITPPAGPGQPVMLQVRARMEGDWHVYSITQPPGGPIRTTIEVAAADGVYRLLGDFQPSTPPKSRREPLFDNLVVETHGGTVVWQAPIEPAAGVDLSQLVIAGTVRAQPCHDLEGCLAPTNYTFQARLATAAATPSPPRSTAKEERVRMLAAFSTPDEEGRAVLVVRGEMQGDWHVYSLTQPPGGPKATTIELTPSAYYEQTGEFQPLEPPKSAPEPLFDNLIVETHGDGVTWQAPIRLTSDPSAVAIDGVVTAQACHDIEGCLAPTAYTFRAVLDPSLRPAAVVDAARLEPVGRLTREADRVDSLGVAILYAFLGGLLLNIMPCVLPVMGLKIMAFFQQAGQNRLTAFFLNFWYAVGVTSVFLLFAAMGLGLGQIFEDQTFTILVACIVFIMALSLMGYWELQVPAFFGGRGANALMQKEGPVGAFFKGVLTTVLAAACGAPLLSPALAWIKGQPAASVYMVFAVIGIGMSFPYLVIGTFPELIRFLPKPGDWMETFKKAMGFLLLIAVVLMLNIMPSKLVVPTISLLFALWFGCWVIGRLPLTASWRSRTTAWSLAAVVSAGTFVVMFTGPPPWQPFEKTAFDRATQSGRTVVVDFTADWCLTCKTLQRTVLSSADLLEYVEKNGIVTMQANVTNDGGPERALLNELGGDTTVPVVAVFPAHRADEPIVFRGWVSAERLISAMRGEKAPAEE